MLIVNMEKIQNSRKIADFVQGIENEVLNMETMYNKICETLFFSRFHVSFSVRCNDYPVSQTIRYPGLYVGAYPSHHFVNWNLSSQFSLDYLCHHLNCRLSCTPPACCWFVHHFAYIHTADIFIFIVVIVAVIFKAWKLVRFYI